MKEFQSYCSLGFLYFNMYKNYLGVCQDQILDFDVIELVYMLDNIKVLDSLFIEYRLGDIDF